MNIQEYDAAMAEEVAASYNRAVRCVPHCCPAPVAHLAAAIAPGVGDGEQEMHSNAVFVALEAARVRGFVHVALKRPCEGNEVAKGIIRFLWYEPGRRRVGQKLLEAGEDHLRRLGMSQVDAFPQGHIYPFYHLWPAYLSDRIGHVCALLGFNGYRRTAGEVFLDWPNFEPIAPQPADIPADIAIEWKPGRGRRPNVLVRARQGEEQVGQCGCKSCGERTAAEEAQDWVMTTSLWVTDRMQGCGLGRHLLQRALQEARGIGYRHAAISTAWDNFRAFLFYSNCGYRVVDWTYGFCREL